MVPGEAARIRLARPDVGAEEAAAFEEVLASGQLTMGPKVAEFEQELARACGTADAVAVSSGTAALHVAVLAMGIGPGHEVLVPAYTFLATATAVLRVNALPIFVDIDPATYNIDPDAVEAAITPRTKALFLGYPANPTGAVLDDDVQDELARIAERHDLLVYSDEIYDRLAYGTYRHRAFSSLPGMRERTILMGGFSKAYAMTGWRVGWMCAPAPILEGIVKVHQYGIMSAPTTAQDAALVALVDGEPEVERMRAEYDRRRRLIVDGLNALGLDTFEPRGAFYAFPKITSTGLDDETFTERLLTYALGRGLDAHDMPTVRAVRAAAAKDDYRMNSIIMGIVQSVPFEMRRTPEQ